MNADHQRMTEPSDADFLSGRLLIAMPGIGDPRFERAVVFLCAHDAEHAIGLAVNRPVDGLTLDLAVRADRRGAAACGGWPTRRC
jgi:putative AlgH/UPF0301 family transcriptional regulator